MKRTRIIITACIVTAIIGFAIVIFLPKDDVPAKTEEERLESEHHAAISLLNQANARYAYTAS